MHNIAVWPEYVQVSHSPLQLFSEQQLTLLCRRRTTVRCTAPSAGPFSCQRQAPPHSPMGSQCLRWSVVTLSEFAMLHAACFSVWPHGQVSWLHRLGMCWLVLAGSVRQ